MSGNPLLEIAEKGMVRELHKWLHYFPIYHKHFKKYKKVASPENKIRLLEIGVALGGSIELWRKYFGEDNVEIVGVDIEPKCKDFEETGVTILIGSQEDETFVKEKICTLPMFDIIIDDGGHTMNQQIVSQKLLFDRVKMGGIYLCEDIHTSYWGSYGGGLYKPTSYIEYTKKLIDELNGHHNGNVTGFTSTCIGIYYYDSMVFFEKPETSNPVPHAHHWQIK